MKRFLLCLLVLLGGVVVGCRDREDQPGVTESAASQPASASGEQPAASRPAREYLSLPESLLEPAPAAKASPMTEWAGLQLALLEGSCEKAVAAYERIKASFPQEEGLLITAGEQLVDALVSVNPPAIPQARAVLKDLESRSAGAADVAGLKARLEGWNVLADLAEGREKLAGDDAAYSAWLADVGGRLARCDRLTARPELLGHVLDHLTGSVEAKSAPVVDRIGRVLTVVQLNAGWKATELLHNLQERRVQILLDGDRPADALFEARILLALSTQDVLAWPAAISRVAAVMAAAGREAAEVERFQAFQSFGPVGADGRSGTADDLKDPLAGVQRKAADQAATATPADPIDQAIQSGVTMILAGEGERATEHFRKLVVSSRPAADRLFALVMDYLAVAQALQAGHGLACEGCAFELAVAKEPIAAAWCDQAYQFLHRHEALVRELIDQGHGELALGLCRSMADDDRLPERSRAAVELAWQACQEVTPGGTAQSALPRFQQFGQTLSSKQARIRRVLLATETLKESGDDAALLAEMASVQDIWDQAAQNPMLALLHASALVRLGRSAEVLGEVEELCRRSDPAPEWRYRAQLLLGVIHIQEGRPAAARAALQRLLDEEPPREDRGRAIIILRKLQM